MVFLWGSILKKLIAVLFVSALTSEARANDLCYKNLTENYTKSSKAFYLSERETRDLKWGNTERERIQFSIGAIKKVARSLQCADRDLRPVKAKESFATCKDLIPGNGMTSTCYIPLRTGLGYFLLSLDMSDNVNLIFNRWD
jgi:hypothetical protein